MAPGIGCGAVAGYIAKMNTRAKGARRPLQGAIALVLALGSNAAMALGLGDIRVLSQPGQPLLAEIPVVSADPGELEAARVALASAATFERVGLERPSGLVSQLQFDFATDAQGRSVIRVRSPGPVEAPVVSFLIEVDWGRGRLVREYSALVDRPHTAAAIEAPQIQAPSLAPSNAIVRAPEVAAPIPLATTPAPAPAPAAAPSPVAASPRVAPAPVPAAAGSMTVASGQTLSQIAVGLARNNGVSLDQAMVALLQANPQAFIGGNIHRLRAGAQLDLPDAQALSRIGAAQARALVREQTGQWRQARTATPQPALAQAADPATPPAAQADGAGTAAAAAGARLEISPAVAADTAAQASQSGTTAGGQGDMLVSEQLRQAREDLLTRDAEIAELRERVAELEKLREQQSSLIALKDNEMAAAQKQMAERPVAADGAGSGLWLWGGGLLLVGAALAALLARRRKPSPLPPLAVANGADPDEGSALADEPEQPVAADAGALDADAMIHALRGGHAVADASTAPATQTGWSPLAMADTPADPVAAEVAEAVGDVPAEPATAAAFEPATVQAAVDHGHADDNQAAPAAAPVAVEERFDAFLPPLEERGMPAEADQPAPLQADQVPPQPASPWGVDLSQAAPLQPAPGSRERLELAIAYLDLGDADTARTLLEEVVTGGDAGSRQQALELLARLG